MQVTVHAGAHMTDEDRLVECLVANRDALAIQGVSVPGPAGYRTPLRDMLHDAQDGQFDFGARDRLLASLTGTPSVERLVLSNPGFFGTPRMTVGRGIFCPAAGPRMTQMRRIFPDDGIELFMAIRNPATLLPALLTQTPMHSIDELLRGNDPTAMRWSELATRLRDAHPDIAITMWCNEDTPLIWSEVMRALAGVDPAMPLGDEFALLSEIMTPVGLERFNDYMGAHPGMTEAQKRRVIAAFLDKYADDAAIEEELDLPGWSEATIDMLTDLYDEDVHEIARLDGVTFLSP